MSEEQQQMETTDVMPQMAMENAPERVWRERASLTPAERAELEYQKKLSSFPPGSPLFNALRRSRRSMRVFRHHAMYWPTGAQLTENGNNNRRSRR